MAPLRVLMLLENNPYPHDIRVRREAEALTAAGHRVTVVAPRRGDQPRRERVDGVAVRRFRLPEGAGVRGLLLEYLVAHVALLFAAALGLAGRRFDVVHLHNPPDTLFPAALLARALGRRSVYDHHDLAPELFADKFGGGHAALMRLLRSAQRAAVRAADAVLVTNESQRDAVVEAWPPAAGRVTIVRNGPPRASVAAAPDVRPGALANPRLVFVGTLESQDGVLALPALLDAVDARVPGAASLTVVGDGTLRTLVEASLAGRQDRVRFAGRVPHAEVARYLGEADIAIEPAPPSPLNDRSTMIKVGEYLAAGLPTVAYPLRETRATAGDAVSYADGTDVASFADCIVRLAGDEDLRRSLAAEALERVEAVTWERSAEALVQVYERLTG